MLLPDLKSYKVPQFHTKEHEKHYKNLLKRLDNIENVQYSLADFDGIYQLAGLYALRDTLHKSLAEQPLIVNVNTKGTTTIANPNSSLLDRVEVNIRQLLRELMLTHLTRYNKVEEVVEADKLDELFGDV